MKKIRTLLAVLAAVTALMTAPMTVSAHTPIFYPIEWTGEQIPVVEISNHGIDEIISIVKVIDEVDSDIPLESSAYTMTGDDSSTTITFNKSFLDTLEEGKHSYCVHIAYNDWRDDFFNLVTLEQDENEHCIFRGKIYGIESEIRVKELSCNIDIDPSLYTINIDKGDIEVVFDKDFIEENGDKITYLSASTEMYTETLHQRIYLRVSPDANSAETYETAYSDYQETGSPKTGDKGIAFASTMLLLSGAGILISRKRK